MTDAPERIFAVVDMDGFDGSPMGIWDTIDDSLSVDGGEQCEYVRADLVPQWQPIETAPDDGTPVQVGWVNSFFHPIVAHKEGMLWGVLGQNMEFTALQVNPTHWMPLQKGPNE